jgi:chorismate mutase/prephenate dehydratase
MAKRRSKKRSDRPSTPSRKLGPGDTPSVPPEAEKKPDRKRSRGETEAVGHAAGSRRPRHSQTPSETERQSAALAELRRKIDRVDQRLVKLLNERASLVVEVGRVKRGDEIPIYAPHREAQVLAKVLEANKGPLPGRTVEGVYRELMSGSFALEQPLRIGYLGPAGSHSHVAAIRQFGSSVELEDLRQIEGVFTEVRRRHVNYGLVPIENSTGGGIVETLDAFREQAGQVYVYAEVQIAIHHALLSNCEPKAIRRIHSKPEVFQQCRKWLSTQYPKAELIASASSSAAVKTAVEEHQTARRIGAEPNSAAIGSALAGDLYGLHVLFGRIEDDPDNITRFAVISTQQAKPTGDDKTSLMFTTEDKPGALVEVLGVFQSSGINLSHIDKRPSGRETWTYTFFVDALGHQDDERVAGAISRARAHCRELVVLGSYPRSTRIL